MFAFSNHMEWWETLNCKGMLAAAGSSADSTMDSDEKTMYCQHYNMTMPTNMAGTIMADSEVDMKIKELFMKRYIVDIDGMTMMHSDTMLMPETEYTYRVSAVNAEGRSMWSEAAMDTTEAAGTTLGAPTDVAVSTLRLTGTVSVTWMKNANAEQTKVVLFNADVTGLGYADGLETYRTANDDGSHTFRQVPAGTYWVVVASFRTGEGHQLSPHEQVTVE